MQWPSFSSKPVCFEYTPSQDFFNWTTHAAGALAAVAFTFVDSFLMNRTGLMAVLTHFLFGLGMVAMFSASALYHASENPVRRRVLKIFDHCAIYAAIVGMGVLLAYEYSYRIGDHMRFYAVSSMLAMSMTAGWLFKLFTAGRFKILSTSIYVVLGWGAAAAAFPVFSRNCTGGLNEIGWLASGGLAYTSGTAFYMAKSFGWTHCVWHLFVLAGAACHMRYVFGLN